MYFQDWGNFFLFSIYTCCSKWGSKTKIASQQIWSSWVTSTATAAPLIGISDASLNLLIMFFCSFILYCSCSVYPLAVSVSFCVRLVSLKAYFLRIDLLILLFPLRFLSILTWQHESFCRFFSWASRSGTRCGLLLLLRCCSACLG